MALDYPITAAVRALRAANVAFVPHLYDYVEKGGTAVSAASLGVPEHSVVKTLVMENERKEPLVVLMHGDREVSTKALARVLGVKTIRPCDPKTADRHSGYQVGGTSPFGLRRAMPIYMERSIAELDTMYVNGGKRGFLVAISPADAIRVLQPTLADIAA
jgi:Cys-tRNA(Pro) deacylase